MRFAFIIELELIFLLEEKNNFIKTRIFLIYLNTPGCDVQKDIHKKSVFLMILKF
jgi:hypothetical protein